MQVFAGVFCFQAGGEVDESIPSLLQSRLSRHPGDRPQLWMRQGCVLAYLDFSADPGVERFQVSENQVACLAGTPILSGGDFNHSSTEEMEGEKRSSLDLLNIDWGVGDFRVLSQTRGSFSCVHMDAESCRVRLATDKLGIRPLYYSWNGSTLFFASSMRMMQLLLPNSNEFPDFVGRAQLSALGYPLGQRTQFENILHLRSGTVFDFDAHGMKETTYWDWNDIAPTQLDKNAFCADLYQRFTDATQRRLKSCDSALAQLSGGLDSRCVVGSLCKNNNVNIHTFNFAPPGTADLILGRFVANAIGSSHLEVVPDEGGDRELSAYRQWLSQLPEYSLGAWCGKIWSGYGGESVLSLIEGTDDMVRAVQANDIELVARLFCKVSGGVLVRQLFRNGVYESLNQQYMKSIKDELQRYGRKDLGRSLRTFIIVHDVRGQHRSHFENIDIRRIEYESPFCDADVVALALSAPLEWVLKHRLYYQWLSSFPEPIYSLPWQAYPTSDPCPIPMPTGLIYQWSDDAKSLARKNRERRRRLPEHWRLLRNKKFPDRMLHRGKLFMAYFLAKVGFSRYLYLLDAATPLAYFFIDDKAINKN